MTELLVAKTFFIIKTCNKTIPDHSGVQNENQIVEYFLQIIKLIFGFLFQNWG